MTNQKEQRVSKILPEMVGMEVKWDQGTYGQWGLIQFVGKEKYSWIDKEQESISPNEGHWLIRPAQDEKPYSQCKGLSCGCQPKPKKKLPSERIEEIFYNPNHPAGGKMERAILFYLDEEAEGK